MAKKELKNRNPIAMACRKLGHKVKPSGKLYNRKKNNGSS